MGDNADKPRFIETVVGKGYRFIAPDRRGKVADPSSRNGEVHFEVVPASVREQAPQVAQDRMGPPAVQEASTGISESQPDIGPTPGAEISPIRPASLHGFGWRSSILAGGLVILVTGFVVTFLFPRRQQQAIPHYEQITRNDAEKDFALGEYPLPILTDSLRLYFSVHNTNLELAIGQVATVGGESGVIDSSLKSPVALAISPDGSSLLVASPAILPVAPLWVQPIPGGQPRRLGHVEAHSASWSPDGHRIAYSTTTGLFTVRSDGTDALQLVTIDPETGEQVYWPRWSTDAERLRYSLYDPRTGKHSLWEVSANGAGAHALLPGWNSAANACCGSWTTDGRFFVFAATQNGRSDIWAIPNRTDLLRQTSLQPVQVTAGPISFSSPLPAADGNIYVAGTETRGELTRWHSESGTLTPWLSGASVVGVTSTRDGQWITYTSFPDRALWRSRIDGSEKLQLTVPPMEAYLPRWSPDGRQIAFYARTPGTPFQIYTVSADGGAPQRPAPSDQQQIDPTWSKTGDELMYESDPWQDRGKERKTQIEIVNLQSGKSTVMPGSAGLVSPRWSPDGRSVAAMRADSGGLVLFDFESQRWTQLLQAQIGYPNWSHDGKYIYFDWFSSPAGVRRIRVADHEVLSVLTRQPGDQLWTSDDWTGLAADDSVLLLRNVSIQEIYAIRWHGQ